MLSNKTVSKPNPLLANVNDYPHITVTLPSRGLFYDDMFADDTDPSELEVHPFSMWEEVHHSNPFSIMSGKASRKMVNTVAPSILNPDGMCAYDIDILMLAGRMASYGEEMKVTLTCGNPDENAREDEEGNKHKCQNKMDMKINLQELINSYPVIDTIDDWKTELSNGQIVYLQPTLYKDALEAMKIGVNQQKIIKALNRFDDLPDDQQMKLNDATVDNWISVKLITTVSSIRAVTTPDQSQTIKDRDMIVEWLQKAPATWIKQIQEKLDTLIKPYGNVGTVDYVCSECGFENKEVNVVQDPSRFFTQA